MGCQLTGVNAKGDVSGGKPHPLSHMVMGCFGATAVGKMFHMGPGFKQVGTCALRSEMTMPQKKPQQRVLPPPLPDSIYV